MKMAQSSSKWIENTVGKGEIARYEQFLLFPQCFQRLLLQTRKNLGLFGKGLRAHRKKPLGKKSKSTAMFLHIKENYNI